MAVMVFHYKVKLEPASPTLGRCVHIYMQVVCNCVVIHVRSHQVLSGDYMRAVIPEDWVLLAEVYVPPCTTMIHDSNIRIAA